MEPLKCYILIWGSLPEWAMNGFFWLNSVLPRAQDPQAEMNGNFSDLAGYRTMDTNIGKAFNTTLNGTAALTEELNGVYHNGPMSRMANGTGTEYTLAAQAAEIACFFPASFSMAITSGTVIFALFTSVVRYLKVVA